jgi:UDP-N-acetylmuramate dehydrogenase
VLLTSVDKLHEVLRQLSALDIGRSCFAEPLSRHSSWRIGGPADLLVEPERIEQIATLICFVQDREIPLVIIGEGSNLLFADAGVRGVVLKIGRRLARVDISGDIIRAQAGVWVPGLAQRAMHAGLGGLEHCIGIPGALGGLVLMNGGSQRRGIGENVQRVTLVDQDGRRRDLSQAECRFGYRRSALQGSGSVVVEVTLCCPRRERAAIRGEMLADLRERRKKFPRKQPNCGSVFLSTPEMHASVGPPGKVIEDCGLKGLAIGQAEVSRQHANFIINRGGASAAEVLQLIRLVRQRVRERIAFELACEVRYVTPAGKIVAAHRTSVE